MLCVGEFYVIRLPRRMPQGIEAFAEFDRIGDELIAEWQRRKKNESPVSPFDSAMGYLKRESYRIIIHFIKIEETSFFERVVRRDGRALTSRVKLDENPFHFGLLALFNGDDVLTRQDRSVFSMQMLYAYRHCIPPKLLIGFSYQSGSKDDIRRKLAEHYVEDGFKCDYKKPLRDIVVSTD